MACRICKRGGCTESFHSFEEQSVADASRAELEREVLKLRREVGEERRSAGYLARMVRDGHKDTVSYAAEILETPEIAAALAAADDDSERTKGQHE